MSKIKKIKSVSFILPLFATHSHTLSLPSTQLRSHSSSFALPPLRIHSFQSIRKMPLCKILNLIQHLESAFLICSTQKERKFLAQTYTHSKCMTNE